MSLEFVDNVINNQLNDCMQFIDISDLALMFFKQCQVDSKQLDSLLNKLINLGISIETFDNNDLSQVMLKFYVVYEIYKRSIIKHKYYTTISDFYNCLNEDIIDYCVS